MVLDPPYATKKYIQCQQQPALLNCVTQMCPCRFVTVDIGHSSAGEVDMRILLASRCCCEPKSIPKARYKEPPHPRPPPTPLPRPAPSLLLPSFLLSYPALLNSALPSTQLLSLALVLRIKTQSVCFLLPHLCPSFLSSHLPHLHTYYAPWRPAHWIGHSTWTLCIGSVGSPVFWQEHMEL